MKIDTRLAGAAMGLLRGETGDGEEQQTVLA
jgi:hypothetical protein